jgi:hypothetical protein
MYRRGGVARRLTLGIYAALSLADACLKARDALHDVAHGRAATLRAAILQHGITIEMADDLGGALGISTGGRVQILKGLPAAEEFVVLAHEFAHLCTGRGYVR